MGKKSKRKAAGSIVERQNKKQTLEVAAESKPKNVKGNKKQVKQKTPVKTKKELYRKAKSTLKATAEAANNVAASKKEDSVTKSELVIPPEFVRNISKKKRKAIKKKVQNLIKLRESRGEETDLHEIVKEVIEEKSKVQEKGEGDTTDKVNDGKEKGKKRKKKGKKNVTK